MNRLALRGLWHFRRAYFPILLGVAIGSMTITGALLVGDSLRSGLKERAEQRRGGVTASLLSPRPVTETLARNLDMTPLILVNATVDSGKNLPIRTSCYGLAPGDRELWQLPSTEGAILSFRAAKSLGVRPGDRLVLRVENLGARSRETFLGDRSTEGTVRTLVLPVGAILEEESLAGEFSLFPQVTPPVNLFVPLAKLQQALELPGRVNLLLATQGTAAERNQRLHSRLSLADLGLTLRKITNPPCLALESDEGILSDAQVANARKVTEACHLKSTRVIVALANRISAPGTARGLPYSIISARDDLSFPEETIALADWEASPLRGTPPGTSLTLEFYQPDMELGLREIRHSLPLSQLIPLIHDPELVPPFPGVTDRLSIRDWKPPFPIATDRLTPDDERFWQEHRATPKAQVSFATAEKLFRSRRGVVTSLRIATDQTASLDSQLAQALGPESAGLEVMSSEERFATAARGGTDFGLLIFLFGSLLLGIGLMLTGLLFRLAIEKRAAEIGLLSALGWPQKKVERLFLTEGIVIAATGSMVGVACALWFSHLLLNVLATLFPDPEAARILRPRVRGLTLGTGWILGTMITIPVIRLSLRGLWRGSVPILLRGRLEPSEFQNKQGGISVPTLIFGLGIFTLLVGPGMSDPDHRAAVFFTGGGLLLLGELLFVRALLSRKTVVTRWPFLQLALRQLSSQRSRSLGVVTLLGTALFLIVSVESFRRRPTDDFLTIGGGSGGFRLVVETDFPLFQSFDQGPGKEELMRSLEKIYQRDGNPERIEHARSKTPFTAFGFRVRRGDDVGCSNLYQANEPKLLGASDKFLDRGGFRFTMTEAETPEERANPWLLLKKPLPDGAIPVIAEQNSVHFMLKTFLGGTVSLRDEQGKPRRARIVALLQDCPFQGELFIADNRLRELYPTLEGERAFFIETSQEDEESVRELLTRGLERHGVQVTSTRERVARFHAVVGAYLTTFQLLGLFALIPAIAGTAAVVLRSVHERAGELALLRAVGWPVSCIRRVLLWETLLLVVMGTLAGTVAAILSVLPNAILGAELPLQRLGIVLVVVVLASLLSTILATRTVAKLPLLATLRGG